MKKITNLIIVKKKSIATIFGAFYFLLLVGLIIALSYSRPPSELIVIYIAFFAIFTMNLLVLTALIWIAFKNAQGRAQNQEKLKALQQTLIGSIAYTNENLAYILQSKQLELLSNEMANLQSKQLELLSNEMAKREKENFYKSITEISALFSLSQRFNQWNITLPVFSGYAINPASLLQILNILEDKRPQSIVELGSGISTLAIAGFLQNSRQGKLVSIEHDETWQARTNFLLSEAGVNKHVVSMYCPLQQKKVNAWAGRWYGNIDETYIPATIEFLLIDGPPKSSGAKARFPAFDFFKSRLKEGSIIVVDDANRKDEAELVEYILSSGCFTKQHSLSPRTVFLECTKDVVD